MARGSWLGQDMVGLLLFPGHRGRAGLEAEAVISGFEDLLTDGKKLWLGELTIYNLSGQFFDVDLRRSWFLQVRHANLLLRLYSGALRRKLAREAQPMLPASL